MIDFIYLALRTMSRGREREREIEIEIERDALCYPLQLLTFLLSPCSDM